MAKSDDYAKLTQELYDRLTTGKGRDPVVIGTDLEKVRGTRRRPFGHLWLWELVPYVSGQPSEWESERRSLVAEGILAPNEYDHRAEREAAEAAEAEAARREWQRKNWEEYQQKVADPVIYPDGRPPELTQEEQRELVRKRLRADRNQHDGRIDSAPKTPPAEPLGPDTIGTIAMGKR